MAPPKSKRSSRKRRRRASAPRAVASSRREEQAERQADVTRQLRRERRQLGREGQRPESPFGGLPVSEFAIFVGLIGAVIGVIQGGGPVLIVGVVVCALGVLEICGREHFAGYRSHTILLAAIPTLAIETGLVVIFGEPQRLLLLVVVVPVYALLFWVLRGKFMVARQARVARPAAPE